MDDAELVRYLDGDGGAAETRRWDRHMAACAPCTDAVAGLRADARLVRQTLDRAELEAGLSLELPTRRRGGMAPWLKAAAILVLLAAPLTALPAVRGWVSERLVEEQERVLEVGSSPASAASAMVLRFTPRPGDFEVRFPDAAGGVLEVRRAADENASLSASGPVEPVVASSSVTLRGAATGRYALALPDAVTGLRVVIGDRVVALDGARIDGGADVTLGSQPER